MCLTWITGYLEPLFHRCGITEFLDACTFSYLLEETERGVMNILEKVMLKIGICILFYCSTTNISKREKLKKKQLKMC